LLANIIEFLNAFLDLENISAVEFQGIFPKPTANFLSVLISQNIPSVLFPNKYLVVVCLMQESPNFVICGPHKHNSSTAGHIT